MAGGPSKINPPNSHPSNPIHKQATQAQDIAPKAPKPATSSPATSAPAPTPEPTPESKIEPHHVNKALIGAGAIALAGFVVWMR